MSLNADSTKLTKHGTVIVGPDGISVMGFDADNASCRDVAVLACLWAAQKLLADAYATVEKPGGGKAIMD